MSIVVAVEDKKSIAIASDARLSESSGKFTDGYGKIVLVNSNALIGHTGSLVMFNALSDYCRRDIVARYAPEMDLDVYGFFLNFRKALLEEYGLINEQPGSSSGTTPFSNLPDAFLTIAPTGIFETSGDFDTLRLARYAAIGQGSEFALGYLYHYYPINELYSALGLAEETCQAVIDNYTGCGGAITSYTIPRPSSKEQAE